MKQKSELHINGNQNAKDYLRVPKTSLVSRNVRVMGRRTSIRLEPEMWQALKEIAKREECTPHDLCSIVSLRKKSNTSLTAAIRVFLMLYFKAAATEEGHMRAGHGSVDRMKSRGRIPDSIPVISRKTFAEPVRVVTYL